MEERGEEWQPAPPPQLPPPPPNSPAQLASSTDGWSAAGWKPGRGKKISMLRPLGHGGKK